MPTQAMVSGAPSLVSSTPEGDTALNKYINQLTFSRSSSTNDVFEQANELKARLPHDHQNLFKSLVKGLSRHCEPLLPIASGKYKNQENVSLMILPYQGKGHLSFEIGHEGGHIAGHKKHYLLHQIHHLDLFHIASWVLETLPLMEGILSMIINEFEIWKEKYVIERIQEQLGKLNVLSSKERDALYQFVISKVLHTLQVELFIHPHVKAWHLLILNQSLVSLMDLPHHFESLKAFGDAWSQAIIRKFKTYGVYMSTALIEYDQLQVEFALKIQSSFKETLGDEYLKLKSIRPTQLKSKFQRELYGVLKEYEHRVSVPNWLNVVFVWYSPVQLNLLAYYFKHFNRALELIAQDKDRIDASKDGERQWDMIECCLKGNLDKMIEELPFIQSANRLSAQTSLSRVSSIPEPLYSVDNKYLCRLPAQEGEKERQIEALRGRTIALEREKTVLEEKEIAHKAQNAYLTNRNNDLRRENAKLVRALGEQAHLIDLSIDNLTSGEFVRVPSSPSFFEQDLAAESGLEKRNPSPTH